MAPMRARLVAATRLPAGRGAARSGLAAVGQPVSAAPSSRRPSRCPTVPLPPDFGTSQVIAAVFVFFADFSRTGTSKDPRALTAPPTILFLYAAVMATVAAASAAAAAIPGPHSVFGSPKTLAVVALSATSAGLLFLFRSRLTGALALAAAVALATGAFDAALSAGAVVCIAIAAVGVASRARITVDPVVATIVVAVAALALRKQQPVALDALLSGAAGAMAVPVAAALAAYETARQWQGGLAAAGRIAVVASPALFSCSCTDALPSTAAWAAKAASFALVVLHVVGVSRATPVTLSPAAPSSARAGAGPTSAAALFVVAPLAATVAVGSSALRVPAILLCIVALLVAHFAARNAPLLPATDADARISGATVGLLVVAGSAAGSAATLATVAVPFAAATAVWAGLQLLAERDGPFFSNGHRNLLIDLLGLAFVFALGGFSLVAFNMPADTDGTADIFAAVAAMLPSALGNQLTALSTAVAAVVPRLCPACVFAGLLVSAELLRVVLKRASVPLAAHLVGPVVVSGKGMRSPVALTFDGASGPDAELFAEQVAREDADDADLPASSNRVTFFATYAEAVAKHESVAVVAGFGHEVGLLVSAEEADGVSLDWLLTAKAAVEAATGEPCRWVRTADGSADGAFVRMVAVAGMTLVLWSSWPRSWAVHPTEAGEFIFDEAQGFGKPGAARGAIVRVVLADGVEPDGAVPLCEEAAIELAASAKERFAAAGYALAPLSEVVAHRGFELEA